MFMGLEIGMVIGRGKGMRMIIGLGIKMGIVTGIRTFICMEKCWLCELLVL